MAKKKPTEVLYWVNVAVLGEGRSLAFGSCNKKDLVARCADILDKGAELVGTNGKVDLIPPEKVCLLIYKWAAHAKYTWHLEALKL